MTKKLDFFGWYPFDFRADTTHLSREANFAFRAIIDEIFVTAQDTCRIVDDDEYLRGVAMATPDEWTSIRRTLIDGPRPLLAKHDDGSIESPRLTEEIRKAQEKTGILIDAGKRRWQKQRESDARAMLEGGSSVAQAEHEPSSDTAFQNKKEKEIKKNRTKGSNPSSITETSNDVSVRAAAAPIVDALREIGLTGFWQRKGASVLAAKWMAHATPSSIAAEIRKASENILASDRPYSYIGGVVRRLSKDGAVGVATTELQKANADFAVRREALRDWAMERQQVYSLSPNEWPFTDITRDEFGAWRRWLRETCDAKVATGDVLNDVSRWRAEIAQRQAA